MHALKMAVFDFDGTLVDSVPAIARGIQLANEEIGIAPVSYETAKSIIGLGDIKLGKAAGVRTIAVTWGAAPLERLEAYKPDAIVRTMEALKTKLDELA